MKSKFQCLEDWTLQEVPVVRGRLMTLSWIFWAYVFKDDYRWFSIVLAVVGTVCALLWCGFWITRWLRKHLMLRSNA